MFSRRSHSFIIQESHDGIIFLNAEICRNSVKIGYAELYEITNI